MVKVCGGGGWGGGGRDVGGGGGGPGCSACLKHVCANTTVPSA